MLFLSDLSRQECTTYTSQQGFDVPDSPTGHGEKKRVFRRQQTQMETGHQMCRTRDRTAFRVRGRDHQLFAPQECAEKHNTFSHLTECADKSTFVLHQVRGGSRQCVSRRQEFALLRVRGQRLVLGRVYQAVTVRYTTRNTTPRRMTMNDANNAATFLMGLHKRTALESVLRSS